MTPSILRMSKTAKVYAESQIRAAKRDVQRLLPRATVTLMQGPSKIAGRASACCFKTKILSTPSMAAGTRHRTVCNVKYSNLSSPLVFLFLLLSLLHLPSTLPTKIQSSIQSLLLSHFDSPRSLSLAELFNRFT